MGRTVVLTLFLLLPPGHQGETANSFLATLASSTSEEMEAELQERVESSQKQANRVAEIYESLKSTVDQLRGELDSGTGEMRGSEGLGAERHNSAAADDSGVGIIL